MNIVQRSEQITPHNKLKRINFLFWLIFFKIKKVMITDALKKSKYKIFNPIIPKFGKILNQIAPVKSERKVALFISPLNKLVKKFWYVKAKKPESVKSPHCQINRIVYKMIKEIKNLQTNLSFNFSSLNSKQLLIW